jgi:type II secretory ATPase GspE/PulE/Tfp pilus assembly ATPase PilB-like protein
MWYAFICDDTPDSLTARLQARPAHLARLEALKAGMITLRQDGWRKVLAGTTTIEEVTRTTAGDIS